MLYSHRIMKAYDFFIRLLKLAITNDINPEFLEFSLVSSYLNMLKDLEIFMNKLFKTDLRKDGTFKLEDDRLYLNLFHDKPQKNIRSLPFGKDDGKREKVRQKYEPFINNDDKKELLRQFCIISYLHDIAMERKMDEKEFILEWMRDVYYELRKMKENFLPVLKKINEINKQKKNECIKSVLKQKKKIQ